MLLRQCFHGLPDGVRLRLTMHGAGRVGLMQRGQVRGEQGVEARHLRRFGAPLFLGMASGAASGDGAQPPAEARGLVQLGKGFECQQKDLLRHILRRSATPDNRLRGQNHRVSVAADQFIEGGQVAEQACQNQLLVGGVGVGDTADTRRRAVPPFRRLRSYVVLRSHCVPSPYRDAGKGSHHAADADFSRKVSTSAR
jgi:hypothetical protein